MHRQKINDFASLATTLVHNNNAYLQCNPSEFYHASLHSNGLVNYSVAALDTLSMQHLLPIAISSEAILFAWQILQQKQQIQPVDIISPLYIKDPNIS
jgi:hypothetical protein